MPQHQASKEAPSLLPLCIHAVCSSSSPRRRTSSALLPSLMHRAHQPPLQSKVTAVTAAALKHLRCPRPWLLHLAAALSCPLCCKWIKKRMKRKKLLGSVRKKEERTRKKSKKEERCGWERKEKEAEKKKRKKR
jgi:heme exporter protein D